MILPDFAETFITQNPYLFLALIALHILNDCLQEAEQ